MITSAGLVTTLAGNGTSTMANGPGTFAAFNVPRGIAFDPYGSIVVADASNNRIRKVRRRLMSL